MPIPFIRRPYRTGSRGWLHEQMFSINNFSGGLNNSDIPTAIADNESPDCLNMAFDGSKSMVTRYGFSDLCNNGKMLSGIPVDGAITHVDLFTYPQRYMDPDFEDYGDVIEGKYDICYIISTSEHAYAVRPDSDIVELKYITRTQEYSLSILSGCVYEGRYYFTARYGNNSVLMVYDGYFCSEVVIPPVYVLEKPTSAGDTKIHLTKDVNKNLVHTRYRNDNGDTTGTVCAYISFFTYKDGEVHSKTHGIKIGSSFDNKTVTLENDEKIQAGEFYDVGTIVTIYDICNFESYGKKISLDKKGNAPDKEGIGKSYFNVTDHYGEKMENGDKTTHYSFYVPTYDELTDTNVGAPEMPPTCDNLTVFQDRLCLSGDKNSANSVYFSHVSDTAHPLYFPSGQVNRVSPTADKIIDMFVFDNVLIVCRKNDIYAIYNSGTTSSTGTVWFRTKKLDTTTGVMCKNCGALLNNYYIFLGSDGIFYKLNTPSSYNEYLMTRPLSYKCDIYSAPISIPEWYEISLSTITHKDEIWWCFRNQNLIIVYNYASQAFTYYKGHNGTALCEYDDIVYLGNYDGYLTCYQDMENYRNYAPYKGSTDTRYHDIWGSKNPLTLHDVPVLCHYYTKCFDLGSPIHFKYFKSFEYIMKLSSDTYFDTINTLTLKVKLDNYTHQVEEKKHMLMSPYPRGGNKDNEFSIGMFGKSLFDEENPIFRSQYFPLDYRARTIQYRLSGLYSYPTSIDSINTIYTTRDLR